MEYKGNITLPSYSEFCESIVSSAAKSNEKVRCKECDGSGEIEEDVMSSQGNWHTTYEFCESCDGEGEVDADEVDNPDGIASFQDYKAEMIEIVRKLSSWTNTDFFLNLGKVKHILKL
ncbi:hypothetical protein ValSw33_40 [Vibrio phage ValSw3-3]|nr:hypothetical protein ValSw33_40 [Vibrio phage ValSw3-3]